MRLVIILSGKSIALAIAITISFESRFVGQSNKLYRHDCVCVSTVYLTVVE